MQSNGKGFGCGYGMSGGLWVALEFCIIERGYISIHIITIAFELVR
jgi:hypothetical protein